MGIVELMVEQKEEEARIEAKEEGIEEGIEKGIEKVGTAMLIEGDPISKIARVTGLSEGEISKLKSEMDKD